ncbi:hypothetical protein [Maridesulfovibrio sp.]|uniref:hypothetical protein n=1 Tax=Maridesulfovibrio sp. TaxID=2795000 RepID=UPI0039EEC292
MCNNEDFNENETQLLWTRSASFSDRNTRLDKFWGSMLEEEGISRGKVKDWIKAGFCRDQRHSLQKAQPEINGE